MNELNGFSGQSLGLMGPSWDVNTNNGNTRVYNGIAIHCHQVIKKETVTNMQYNGIIDFVLDGYWWDTTGERKTKRFTTKHSGLPWDMNIYLYLFIYIYKYIYLHIYIWI